MNHMNLKKKQKKHQDDKFLNDLEKKYVYHIIKYNCCIFFTLYN